MRGEGGKMKKEASVILKHSVRRYVCATENKENDILFPRTGNKASCTAVKIPMNRLNYKPSSDLAAISLNGRSPSY
jgi:hypothetical protein